MGFRETRFGFRENSHRTPDSQGGVFPAWGALALRRPKGIQTDRKEFGAAEKLCILGYGCQEHCVRRAGLGLIVPLGNESNFALIPQKPKYASSRLPTPAGTFKRSATKSFFQRVDTNVCVASRFVSRFA